MLNRSRFSQHVVVSFAVAAVLLLTREVRADFSAILTNTTTGQTETYTSASGMQSGALAGEASLMLMFTDKFPSSVGAGMLGVLISGTASDSFTLKITQTLLTAPGPGLGTNGEVFYSGSISNTSSSGASAGMLTTWTSTDSTGMNPGTPVTLYTSSSGIQTATFTPSSYFTYTTTITETGAGGVSINGSNTFSLPAPDGVLLGLSGIPFLLLQVRALRSSRRNGINNRNESPLVA